MRYAIALPKKAREAIFFRSSKNSNELGVIDTVVALSLASLLVIIFCHHWAQSVSTTKLINRFSYSIRAKQRLSSVLAVIIRDIDQHRLPLIPRIHPPGRILLSNGLAHKISSRSDTLAPHPKAKALSYLQLAPSRSVRIHSSTMSGDQLQAHTCPIRPERSSLHHPLFLSVTPDRFEVLRTTHHVSLESGCAALSLSAIPVTILSEAKPSHLLTHRYLIPIRRIYTLYIDREKTLRIISHMNATDSAPQPITANMPILSFNAAMDQKFSLVTLSAFEYPKTKPFLLKTNRLSRTSALNQLLNQQVLLK